MGLLSIWHHVTSYDHRKTIVWLFPKPSCWLAPKFKCCRVPRSPSIFLLRGCPGRSMEKPVGSEVNRSCTKQTKLTQANVVQWSNPPLPVAEVRPSTWDTPTRKTPNFCHQKTAPAYSKLRTANYPSAVSGHCSWATHLTKTSHPRWRCSSLLNPRIFTPQWRKSPCLGDSNMYMEDVWLHLKMNTCLVLYKRVFVYSTC